MQIKINNELIHLYQKTSAFDASENVSHEDMTFIQKLILNFNKLGMKPNGKTMAENFEKYIYLSIDTISEMIEAECDSTAKDKLIRMGLAAYTDDGLQAKESEIACHN